jgi:hypothetical protein
LSVEGFEKTNYFGYEDDILLDPSEEWLKENGDEPFLAEYLLGTGHDDYRCLSTRYGSEDFSEDAGLNSYLNCIRYQDLFLKNLFEQYKALGSTRIRSSSSTATTARLSASIAGTSTTMSCGKRASKCPC